MKAKDNSLKANLKRLGQIAEWFDAQEEVDVEEGLKKVEEATSLISGAKKQLIDIENRYEEIKREIKK